MEVLLIAGLWLDGSAWAAVVPHLKALGHADFFDVADGVMAFPGWGPFEGPDSDDLDSEQRRRIADAAIPVPETVAKGVVQLRDERRLAVPVTLICPEFSPDQAKEWINGGQLPEISKAQQIDYIDIDSGHWPMFTQPIELARLLAEAAPAGA